MDREPRPERSIPPVDEVTITVVPAVRRPFLNRRTLAATAAVAALGAIVAAVLQIGSTTATRARTAAGEKAAIAAAFGYPYPRECLAITISASNPDYARARVDSTDGCGRYRGYVNASFHRVGGRWTLVLDEGQLFVPNRLLLPARRAASARRQSASVRYPVACLGLAIVLHDPRFVSAGFDRTICQRTRPA